MHLKSLGLEQFRCYERTEVDFGPGLIVLVGDNASGKTTVLEAIHLLAVTKSHRTTSDRELIRWGEQWSRVRGVFCVAGERDLNIRVTLSRQTETAQDNGRVPRKSVELDATPRRRLADIIGRTAVVLFGPDELALIKGPPGVRRRFLNEAISQVRPAYLNDLIRYRRALGQRNACLRMVAHGGGDHGLVTSWDAVLREAGARVSQARADFVAALAQQVGPIHHELSAGTEAVEVAYVGDLADALDLTGKQALMREYLAANVERDIALGRTLRGPHRDEMQVKADDRSVRHYGSQGQQRTAALTVTLAAAEVIHRWRDDSPIVLLDDCLSELDPARARRILALCERVEQVFITTASWSAALDEFAAHARVYEVGDGTIRQRAPEHHAT